MVAPFSKLSLQSYCFEEFMVTYSNSQTKPVIFDSVVVNGNPRSFFVKQIDVHILPKP